jgi:adenylate cyclase
VIILVIFSYLFVGRYVLELNVTLTEFAFDAGSFAIYFYLIFTDIFLTIVGLFNQVLGEGNLWRLLKGRFYNPREEERIFMFIDLYSSTDIAERLGHIHYSKLIQDCFDDLSVIAQCDAEIYQYVGDGAILTWKLDRGLKASNCLMALYLFRERIQSREKHYLKRFGVMPLFKAGINAGLVTVTEVGRYKREIAYHGDTINTAARVQGKCNELGKDFLITENLLDRLTSNSFTFMVMGEVTLRGKRKETKVYAIEQNRR